MAGGLSPYAIFAPTPIPSMAKVPILPWPIRSLELSLCGTFVPMFFILSFFYSASALLAVRTRCSVRLSGASCLAPTKFAAEYCLTHAITHHPPKTDPPCSAVSQRQLGYLLDFCRDGISCRQELVPSNSSIVSLFAVRRSGTCPRGLRRLSPPTLGTVHSNLSSTDVSSCIN